MADYNDTPAPVTQYFYILTVERSRGDLTTFWGDLSVQGWLDRRQAFFQIMETNGFVNDKGAVTVPVVFFTMERNF